MSHVAIPHLADVSLLPCHQSVMEGVLTRARGKPRNGSAGEIPAQGSTWGDPPALTGKKVRPAPEFPRVRTDQFDHAVLCAPPGSLGQPALLATPVTFFTAERNSHVL
jgi:hypothetical protein